MIQVGYSPSCSYDEWAIGWSHLLCQKIHFRIDFVEFHIWKLLNVVRGEEIVYELCNELLNLLICLFMLFILFKLFLWYLGYQPTTKPTRSIVEIFFSDWNALLVSQIKSFEYFGSRCIIFLLIVLFFTFCKMRWYLPQTPPSNKIPFCFLSSFGFDL